MRRGKRERGLLKAQWEAYRNVKREVIIDNLSNDPPQSIGRYATARSFESTLHAARPMKGGSSKPRDWTKEPVHVNPPKFQFPTIAKGSIVRVLKAGPNSFAGKAFERKRDPKHVGLKRV